MKTKPKRIGRPYKLTPALKARVLALAKEGHFLQTIAAACRISRDSLNVYRRADKAFSDELDAAMAGGEMVLANVVMRAALKGDLDSARWLLLHRHQHWQPKVTLEITRELSGFAADLRNRLPPEALKIVDAVVEEHLSGGGTDDDGGAFH